MYECAAITEQGGLFWHWKDRQYGTLITAVVKLSEVNLSNVLNILSLYQYKALYVHPKALNGDTKSLYRRSKLSNEEIIL